ncbi:anti-phage dCTP deaminase [Thioalkalivibrio sp. ALJT]|uniref:anti-phage dCTP deaminase n=1 Tax=Thioalkalivibrio sp. ALJT TaxID=1158146 RepID=UPI00039E1A97|nr:anti-phage dCTP deaminase [Thioalkalivibrio sp. ALJT]
MSLDASQLLPSDPLESFKGPELFIGLVGPIGTNRDEIYTALNDSLHSYGYETKRVRLSSTLHEVDGLEWLPEIHGDEFTRIERHMRAGTKVREITGRADALAYFAVAEIRRLRAQSNEAEPNGLDWQSEPELLENTVQRSTAYVLDSLKHPKEIETLRAIYGRAFITISIHTTRSRRVTSLTDHLKTTKPNADHDGQLEQQATMLVQIDEKEEGTELGQKVRSAFPKADFFLNEKDTATIRKDVKRFLELLFNHPFRTPTIDEYGMFFAEASSWRSADLSRQVGAAILSDKGEIISVGFNEVPKAFGGYNWEGDQPDHRDFQNGKDPGTKHKNQMVAEIIHRMADSDLITSDNKKQEAREIASKITQGKETDLLKDIKAANVIEFGRSVHAEMAAICDAASRGVSIKGAQLFVNTFPCHICARHILASGISRVVYIEPYPKSLTTDLYRNQITEDSSEACSKVPFEAFRGVSPRQYQFFFKLQSERKDSAGQAVNWSEKTAEPRMQRYVLSYIALEQAATGEIIERLISKLSHEKDQLEALKPKH